MQPAMTRVRKSGLSVSGLARRYQLDRSHLDNVLRGRTAPSHEVRVALTDALDVPVTELFDADALTRTYRPRHRRIEP